jgi:hypothetical protein
MEPSHEIVCQWILSLAIECARKVSDFVPYVDGLALNVRPVPGAGPDHYSKAFLALFDAGLIDCFTHSSDDRARISASRTEIDSVLAARLRLPMVTSKMRLGMHGPIGSVDPDLWWELTETGGNEWERLAEPSWDRYVFFLFGLLLDENSPKAGDAWSASLDSLNGRSWLVRGI